jgi:phage host-nuclease inhibitor protein Gam
MPLNPETAPLSMTPLSSPVPTIQTRAQLEMLLENMASLQRERDDLFRAQEQEIAAVRQHYRAALTEMDTFLHLETSWAEAWARAHPEALAADRSLACAHATIGFCAESPRLERASRRWTWTRIAVTLAGLAWGKRYLRIPAPEVDKDALLADLDLLSTEDLRSAGLRVVQGERFFVTTPEKSELAWQEAA